MLTAPPGYLSHMAQQSLFDETAAPLHPAPPKPRRSFREAAAGCKACPLWKIGTQTVFGEGREGRGHVRRRAAGRPGGHGGQAVRRPGGAAVRRGHGGGGIDRSPRTSRTSSSTSSGRPRGKRRIHQKPSWSEVAACLPWLEAELAVVKPRVLVCLGATAAQALLGRQFRVTQRPRRAGRVRPRAGRDRDRPSVVDPARRRPGRRAPEIRQRPEDGRRAPLSSPA